MDHTINNAITDAQQSLLDTYTLELTYGKNGDSCYAKMLDLFEETLKMKEMGKKYELALEKAKMQVTIEDFEQEYNAELKNDASKTQMKRTKEYKEFQEKLNQIKNAYENRDTRASTSNGIGGSGNRVESDDIVMETEICTTDPLTKRRMENPMKNKICGHHYEEKSILEAIAINPRLRCPVAGCGNNTFVQRKDLVRDEQLKIQLTNMYSQEDNDPLC